MDSRGLEARTDASGHFAIAGVSPDATSFMFRTSGLHVRQRVVIRRVWWSPLVRRFGNRFDHASDWYCCWARYRPMVSRLLELKSLRSRQSIVAGKSSFGACCTWRMARTDSTGAYQFPHWNRVSTMSPSAAGRFMTGGISQVRLILRMLSILSSLRYGDRRQHPV